MSRYLVLDISILPDAEEATRTARQFAIELGFDNISSHKIAIAASELASNLLDHAYGGTLEIRILEPRHGLQLLASDAGPGIADIELSMTDGYSSKGSLGSGLPAVGRLMDEIAIDSHVGKGSRVWACKWL